MRLPARSPVVVLCTTSALLVAGCGSASAPDAGTAPVSGPERFAAAITTMGYGDNVDRLPAWYRTLDELLPSTTYALPDGTTSTASELTVLGRVVEVEPGQGGKDAGNDNWVDTDYDDPDAWSRTIHVVVEVEASLGPPAPERVRVGFAMSPEVQLDEARQWFAEAGRLVLFLTRSPVFDDVPDMWGVHLDGAMVAQVGDGGSLTMPFTPDRRERRLLARTPTLDDLVAASAEERTIELVDRGGWFARPDR